MDEYEGSALVRKFIYGPCIDKPIVMIDVTDNNTVYYYHFDGLSSGTTLSDETGAVVEKYSCDVYGQSLIRSATPIGNAYFFTGQREHLQKKN